MKYMEVTSPWPVHEFGLAVRGGIYLCVLWNNPEFFKTYPTFISSPLVMPSRAHQALNTFFWDTLYFVKPLEPKILKELKI